MLRNVILSLIVRFPEYGDGSPVLGTLRLCTALQGQGSGLNGRAPIQLSA